MDTRTPKPIESAFDGSIMLSEAPTTEPTTVPAKRPSPRCWVSLGDRSVTSATGQDRVDGLVDLEHSSDGDRGGHRQRRASRQLDSADHACSQDGPPVKRRA